MSTTQSSRLINASPDILYRAFTDPKAVEAWMAPGEMSKKGYTARFITLQENKRIVEGIRFDSDGSAYVGEMIMEVRFEREGKGTLVTMIFSNIPLGVRPEDSEKGAEQSLEKLENYVRGK